MNVFFKKCCLNLCFIVLLLQIDKCKRSEFCDIEKKYLYHFIYITFFCNSRDRPVPDDQFGSGYDVKQISGDWNYCFWTDSIFDCRIFFEGCRYLKGYPNKEHVAEYF